MMADKACLGICVLLGFDVQTGLRVVCPQGTRTLHRGFGGFRQLDPKEAEEV